MIKYSDTLSGPLGLWHVKNIFISFISQGSAASLFIILISNPTETPHTNYHIHTIKGTILMLTKQQSHQHNLKTLQETAITLYLINRSLYTQQQQQLCICDDFLLKVCKHLKMLTYRLWVNSLNIHNYTVISAVNKYGTLGIGEYKYLLPKVIFIPARSNFSCSHSSLSLAAPVRFLGGHQTTSLYRRRQ